MRQNKAFVIGIIGGAGVGKTYVADYLCKQLNATFIEGDKVGHRTLELSEIKAMLKGEFGEDIVKEDVVDRQELGSIVFNDKKSLRSLNAIMHPTMYGLIKEDITKSTKAYVVLEAAVMIEAKFYELVDKMLLLEASKETRLVRLTESRRIDTSRATSMIKAENPLYRAYADIVIDTSKGFNGYKEELDRFIDTLQEERNETF